METKVPSTLTTQRTTAWHHDTRGRKRLISNRPVFGRSDPAAAAAGRARPVHSGGGTTRQAGISLFRAASATSLHPVPPNRSQKAGRAGGQARPAGLPVVTADRFPDRGGGGAWSLNSLN